VHGLVRLRQLTGVCVAGSTQGLTHLAVHFSEPELDPRLTKTALQFDQEFDTREIGMRNVAHEEDDEAWRSGASSDQGRDAIADVIDVEVEERSFTPDHQYIIDALVLGMTG